MLEREALEVEGRRLQRRDAVEHDPPRHTRDRCPRRRRARHDPRALPRPADRERHAELARARVEKREIELEDVPSAEHVGIERDDLGEQPHEQLPLVTHEDDRSRARGGPARRAFADEDTLMGRRRHGRGEERPPEAVGLDVERENRQRDVEIGRRLDLRALEVEDAAALLRHSVDAERSRDEALHHVAVRWLHVGLERGLAELAHPCPLLDEGALRAEVERVDRLALHRREGSRHTTPRMRDRHARDEHHGLLPWQPNTHRRFLCACPEDDLDAVVRVAPLARQEERIDLPHRCHRTRP